MFLDRLLKCKLTAVAALVLCCLMAACQNEEPEPVVPPDDPITPPEGVTIVDTVHYADIGVTAYNFTYPSVDPYGMPAVLSAAIVVGDDIVQSKHARGLLLYNHFTIFRADECPTRGGITMEQKMSPSGLITVSADYYGFGVTEQMNQAYCMADVNAQASIDALLAAKRLLAWKGYSWDDRLFVAGYSQGGQTAIGVVKRIAEHHPELHITYTFAGAGPYDIATTYRQMVADDIAGQPSTVVSVLLTYNQYRNLGVSWDEMFIDPVLSHIDDWVLSKQYTRTQIDNLMGGLSVSQFFTPAMMNFESNLSCRFIQEFEQDNLCNGWTPRADEPILLFHNTSDLTVPPVNTENLALFLQQHGVEPEVFMSDVGSTAGADGHTIGAVPFSILAINRMAEILQIEPWSIF